MCGIAGFIHPDTAELEAVAEAMAAALVHRGPDDAGVWTQRDVGLALAFRRLAIVDLTAAGHQPMRSPSGRYQLIFNGEIYNHVQLRREVEASVDVAPAWRGHSDTETLLGAVEAWGLERALQRAIGMFALALWDRQRRVLTLARDRAGEKPLYYGRSGDAFLFGSELKALRMHPAFRAEVDRDCLALYLRYCYVPEPYSIYRGIARVPAGTMVEVDEAGHAAQPRAYWSAAQLVARPERFVGTDAQAIDSLDRLLTDAVGLQMVADVPLGAFLSGGIDSSLIVALMQKQAAQPVRTFTIGFTERAYDESGYARAVARHLGTEHTELVVTPAEAQRVIPHLATIYDEPFADSSQIPTFLVAQLARRHVTVALSGDAGDELFGGYNRYAWARRLWSALRVQGPMRRLTARALRALPPERWSGLFEQVRPVVPKRWHVAHLGDKLHKLADFIDCSRGELYFQLVSHWPAPAKVVRGSTEPPTVLAGLLSTPGGSSFEECMMYWDFMTYLPNDILVKVDRAAMAVSLETRVPMLDHRVIEFAWSLPLALRLRQGEGKWILKQLLSRYVPPALTTRPKTGFGIPIDSWLRGPLREWAEELLDENRLRTEGFFEPEPIREKWRAHVAGGRNWAYWLWDVLMFQAWWSEQRSFEPNAAMRSTRTAIG